MEFTNPNSENTQEIRAMYSKDEIDVFTLGDIERAKNTLLGSVNSLTTTQIHEQLNDLLSLMQTILEKYFTSYNKDGSLNRNNILNQKIDVFNPKTNKNDMFNFYDIKAVAENVYDPRILRKIMEMEFTIYNLFIKQLGVAIPTTRTDFKKKLIERLFGITFNFGQDFIDAFLLRYKEALKITKLADSPLVFEGFCISEMPKYDLDSTHLFIGFARIGKSTLVLDLSRIIYCFKYSCTLGEAETIMIINKFTSTHIIYDQHQKYESAIKNLYADIVIGDEMYLLGDKRQGMYGTNINLTQKLSTHANHNLIHMFLIQQLTDLDQRYLNKANTIHLLTARGDAYLYSTLKNFSIIKQDYDFDYLQKNPWLFRSLDLGLESLKKPSSFITNDISWDNLKTNKIYASYLLAKAEWQEEDIDPLDFKIAQNTINDNAIS